MTAEKEASGFELVSSWFPVQTPDLNLRFPVSSLKRDIYREGNTEATEGPLVYILPKLETSKPQIQKVETKLETMHLIVDFLAQHVVLKPEQYITLALWVAHCHTIDAAEITPYINLFSPTRGNAKSTCAFLLSQLTPRAQVYEGCSSSSLIRALAEEGLPPTTILDEMDTVFSTTTTESEKIRQILNAGFERDGIYRMSDNSSGKWKSTEFPVWGPKVIAGIGKPPDTIASRSIPILISRKTERDHVERVRRRKVKEIAGEYRGVIAKHMVPLVSSLMRAEPELPEELGDREADIWEPLFAIADEVGGNWPQWARQAAILLRAKAEDETAPAIILLQDVYRIFAERDETQIRSMDLLMKLNSFGESPWPTWQGRGLDAYSLRKLLQGFGIASLQLKAFNSKGFRRDQFEEAWLQYRIGR